MMTPMSRRVMNLAHSLTQAAARLSRSAGHRLGRAELDLG